jgi:hypothetical protein
MWRIVPNFDYYGDYTSGTPEPNEEEDQESELDPIHVAGSASLNWFKKVAGENGLLFARDAVIWLTSSVGDLLIKEKRPPPPRHETREVSSSHTSANCCNGPYWNNATLAESRPSAATSKYPSPRRVPRAPRYRDRF